MDNLTRKELAQEIGLCLPIFYIMGLLAGMTVLLSNFSHSKWVTFGFILSYLASIGLGILINKDLKKLLNYPL